VLDRRILFLSAVSMTGSKDGEHGKTKSTP